MGLNFGPGSYIQSGKAIPAEILKGGSMRKETQTDNSPLQEVASILANGIIRMRKKKITVTK
jgi:hypothetical protein